MSTPQRTSSPPTPPPLSLIAMPPTAMHPLAAVDPDGNPGTLFSPMLLTFRWLGDRYGHVLEIDERSVAESIDGDSQDSWPPSAPVQQLTLETLHGKPVLLGVGAAGRSHWSVSVEAIERDGVPGFSFDWACRLKPLETIVASSGKGSAMKGSAMQVGSEYRLDERIAIIPCEGTLLERIDGHHIRLSPEHPRSGSTLQWRYRIEEGKASGTALAAGIFDWRAARR